MTNKLKAFAVHKHDEDFQAIELAMPEATEHDLLVKIEAIALNPVDTKVKASLMDRQEPARILGWDAVGTVVSVGSECSIFKAGDKVFYAGDVSRAGCNASHQLVDERIVGKAPENLSAEQCAAMPLTSITAWEALFSRLNVEKDNGHKSILIIGGAGGVGSIAIQLAKVLTQLTVITTASRPESVDWCRQMGADHIVNHHQDIKQQFTQLELKQPDYIFCCADTDPYFDVMADLIAPEGMICAIVDTRRPQQLAKSKSKSAGFVWEFMFTRARSTPQAKLEQHHILTQVSTMLDTGQLKSTHTKTVGPLSNENLNLAHQMIKSGATVGKIVLSAIKD
jgi:zinc-binding alcohol dehydrogenase family protein